MFVLQAELDSLKAELLMVERAHRGMDSKLRCARDREHSARGELAMISQQVKAYRSQAEKKLQVRRNEIRSEHKMRDDFKSRVSKRKQVSKELRSLQYEAKGKEANAWLLYVLRSKQRLSRWPWTLAQKPLPCK